MKTNRRTLVPNWVILSLTVACMVCIILLLVGVITPIVSIAVSITTLIASISNLIYISSRHVRPVGKEERSEHK